MSKKGLLLLNIGSPKSYDVSDVKKYLRTFLMDKDIINIPFLARWFLVNCIIVPRRSSYSAGNYKKIWMEGGSPLLVYTVKFAEKLQKAVGDRYSVKIGMRYSDPSIETALREFANEGIEEVLLVPLYPQYAEATTGSSLKEVEHLLHKLKLPIKTQALSYFYAAPPFVDSSAKVIEESLRNKTVDHYLFSFHGLPESQVRKVHGCLRSEDCCFEKNACDKPCYRAQCFASASAIAQKLHIPASHWSVSFQSRLGRGEWLKPATDHSLQVLAESGRKKIAVICPSFVADCIETLEEIGMGGKELFIEHGGEEFDLIPCVNDEDHWITNFQKLI